MGVALGHLRVYQPLDGLPEAERIFWSAYLAAGRAPEVAAGVRWERAAAMAALLGARPRLPGDGCDEQAFVLHVDGRAFICPWWTTLRCLSGLRDFCRGIRQPELFGWPAEVRTEFGDAELSIRGSRPQACSGIQSSLLPVPLGWLALFAVDDSVPDPLGEDAAVGRCEPGPGRPAAPPAGASLRYRTSMVRARQRAARARHAVERRLTPQVAAGVQLEEVARWLEEFHPHSWVELDFEGGQRAVHAQAVAEAGRTLAALERGKLLQARAAYLRLLLTCREVAAAQPSN